MPVKVHSFYFVFANKFMWKFVNYIKNKLTRIVNKTLLRTYCASDDTPFIRSFAEKKHFSAAAERKLFKTNFFRFLNLHLLMIFWYNATTKLVALCVFRYGFKLFATMRILIKLLYSVRGTSPNREETSFQGHFSYEIFGLLTL